MKISFSPLLSVTPQHAYYSGGCRDIEFIPTSASADLLRAGRCIARTHEGTLHLHYETDGPNTPLSSLAGHTLYFGLRLANPYFPNFTAPVIAEARLTPLYANTTAPTALDAPIGVALGAGIYAHMALDSDRPLDVILRTSTGTVLQSGHLQAGQDSSSFDLRGLPDGAYFIDEEHEGALTLHRPLLVNADLRDYGVWGVLALTIDASFYASAPSFSISFTPRSETLRYYVVASNFPQAEFDQLNISDGDSAVVFDKLLPDFPDGYLDHTLLATDGAMIALFESQTAIERRERGQRRLRLNRNATTLIEHLPLPGPEKARADLIVHLSKP